MTTRPRLITSIPFWILFIGSLGLTGLGTWIVLDRLGRLDETLRNPCADQVEATVNVYVGQPAAVVGAIVLGAGLVGLMLTLALAAWRSLAPKQEVDIEAIDWTSDDETVGEVYAPATTAAPVIAEDPDVEVPTSTPAPARATHDEPALQTEAAPSEDDKRA